MGNSCCGSNQNESCGWPRGTIRALVSVITIILTFMIAGAGVIYLFIHEQITAANGILALLFNVVSAIVAWYFGTKSGDAAAKTAIEASEKLLESKDRELNMLREHHERVLQSRGLIMPPNRHVNNNNQDEYVVNV
jgi:hypothetical protein